MAKHAAPEEDTEQQLDEPEIPTWQIGMGICFIVFFATLGLYRIVLEFVL